MTPNSTKITNMIETGFTYLRDMLAKVEITVKDNFKIRVQSDRFFIAQLLYKTSSSYNCPSILTTQDVY